MSAIKAIWYALAGAVVALTLVSAAIGLVFAFIWAFKSSLWFGWGGIVAVIGACIGLGIYSDDKARKNNRGSYY